MAPLIFSLLLCMGWLVAEHFPPWLAFHNEAPAFAGLALASVVALWKSRGSKWTAGSAQLAIVLLLMLPVIQYALGQLTYAGDVWLTWAYGGGFLLAWTLGRLWADERRTTRFDALETLALAFVVGGTVSALMGITQWLGQEDLWGPWLMNGRHSNRILANLGQPNQLSTLLLMGVVSACVLCERQLMSRGLLSFLVLLLSGAVILTQSRTGLLIVSLLALAAWTAAPALKQITRGGVVAWAVLVWLGTWLFQSQGSAGVERAVQGEQMLQPGLRPLLWRQILEGLSQAPWAGYGWLQVPAAQQAGALEVPGLEQALYAHNHLLDLVVWIGVPLTLLTVVLVVRQAWRRRHAIRDQRVVFLLLWMLPVATHAMLESPLVYAYFLLPMGVLLGMLDRWSETGGEQTIGVRAITLVPLTLLYAGLLCGIAYDYIRVEEDFRVARFENRRLGQTPAGYEVPGIRTITHLGAVLQAMRLRATPGMDSEDLELLHQASRRFSWPPLHFRYALALGLNGRAEDAAHQMRVIKGLYGDKIYAEAADDFRRLRDEKYPELGNVELP